MKFLLLLIFICVFLLPGLLLFINGLSEIMINKFNYLEDKCLIKYHKITQQFCIYNDLEICYVGSLGLDIIFTNISSELILTENPNLEKVNKDIKKYKINSIIDCWYDKYNNKTKLLNDINNSFYNLFFGLFFILVSIFLPILIIIFFVIIEKYKKSLNYYDEYENI